MVFALECFTEILMSKKSSSSRILASFRADSTRASGEGRPYFSRRSFSSDPAFTPMRMGTPLALASRAISLTLSWYLMLPGLIRSPWIPASRAAMAYFHWKWMSATTGTVDFAAIALSASASSQCGTATRTMSTPAATSDAICCNVASMSAVFVVVMDWTLTGASPPIATRPSWICRDFLRSTMPTASVSVRSGTEHVERDGPVLRLVHLEEDQPLPAAEARLAGDHGDRVRRRREEHRLDVRVAVLALVFVHVLGPHLEVVVRVVDAVVGDDPRDVLPEILQRPVFPLVDQEGAGGVGTERHHGTVGDTRILDRPPKVVRQVDVLVPVAAGHGDARGRGLHLTLLSSAATAASIAGRSTVNALPWPGSIFGTIRPPCASTMDRAIARPIPVPPSSRDRAGSTR